MMMIINY